MKTSTFGLLALGLTLAIVDFPSGGMPGGGSLMKEAHAVVGRPLTPVSVAGVARRTTRRVVATTTYVAALPPSCTVDVIEGTSLHQCGTTYYQQSGTQFVVVKIEGRLFKKCQRNSQPLSSVPESNAVSVRRKAYMRGRGSK